MHRPRPLLPVLLLTLLPLAAPRAAAQDADPPPLAAHEVARVDGTPVPAAAFEEYVGSAEARSEHARAVIRQAHDAALVRRAADAAGVQADPARVDAVVARLEARAGASLAAYRGDPRFEERLALLARQVQLMQREQGLSEDEAFEPAAQEAWLAERRERWPLREHPLRDELAASWEGGELTRRELGARLLEQLPEEERAGLLTEFLGVLLLHARARELGVELTADAAAEALAEREALVAANPSTQGLSYADILEQTQGLTTEELVASPRFAAEVLLREMVDRSWTEEELRAFFERERELFEERYGEGVDFAGARHGVLQEVRQRSYQKLVHESTIVRRY